MFFSERPFSLLLTLSWSHMRFHRAAGLIKEALHWLSVFSLILTCVCVRVVWDVCLVNPEVWMIHSFLRFQTVKQTDGSLLPPAGHTSYHHWWLNLSVFRTDVFFTCVCLRKRSFRQLLNQDRPHQTSSHIFTRVQILTHKVSFTCDL